MKEIHPTYSVNANAKRMKLEGEIKLIQTHFLLYYHQIY